MLEDFMQAKISLLSDPYVIFVHMFALYILYSMN